jgi:hypothetical protein
VPLPTGLQSIAGAQELYDWLGYWPDFHDAEIIVFRFDLNLPASLIIHTWQMSDQVDAKGYYEHTKDVVVEFTMQGVSLINVQDPLNHSILFELSIDKIEKGFRLSFDGSYGISGTIETQELSLQIRPGKPTS